MKIRLAMLLSLIAILALATPAAASTYATITYAEIHGHNVVIGGSVPCAHDPAVNTIINSWKIKITVTAEPNPEMGICSPDAGPVNFGEFVFVTLSRPKDVYVNDVYIGVMYP